MKRVISKLYFHHIIGNGDATFELVSPESFCHLRFELVSPESFCHLR